MESNSLWRIYTVYTHVLRHITMGHSPFRSMSMSTPSAIDVLTSFLLVLTPEHLSTPPFSTPPVGRTRPATRGREFGALRAERMTPCGSGRTSYRVVPRCLFYFCFVLVWFGLVCLFVCLLACLFINSVLLLLLFCLGLLGWTLWILKGETEWVRHRLSNGQRGKLVIWLATQ